MLTRTALTHKSGKGVAASKAVAAARSVIAFAVALVIAVPANAQTTVTWNGSDAGNANWSVAGNWTSGTAPSGSVALVFGSGGSATTSFNDIANLTVTSGSFGGLARTITGSAITLGGNLTYNVNGVSTIGLDMTLSANRTFAIGSGTLALTGVISGSTFNKTQAGALRLTAANTFTGAVNIQRGAVEVTVLANTGVASSLGTSGTITLGSNLIPGTLRYLGTSNASTDRPFRVGGQGENGLENDGAGTLTFTNPLFNGAVTTTATNAIILALGGTNAGNNEIQGIIADNGAKTISVSKNGSGRWLLSGVNTYKGSTGVTAGTLQIGPTGSINSTSGITIDGATAELRYNSATALAKSVTLTQGTLSGTGTIGSAVTADSLAATLSPGNSPGIMPFSTSQSWESFTYLWETNNFLGTTAGTDFDRITIAGSLALTGSAGSYLLDITSLTAGNIAGNVGNFSDIDRSWTILTTTDGISGFNASHWTVSPANFTSSPAATGSWSISNVGNDLVLNYVVVVPEPATLTLAGIGALLAGLVARRRRSSAARP